MGAGENHLNTRVSALLARVCLDVEESAIQRNALGADVSLNRQISNDQPASFEVAFDITFAVNS